MFEMKLHYFEILCTPETNSYFTPLQSEIWIRPTTPCKHWRFN